ncbi:MAG TPA: hypothetical protein VLI07_01300 [Candidatus Binatus sp.]|nr:hypothetical protein [Candidatus Binatus sp.]
MHQVALRIGIGRRRHAVDQVEAVAAAEHPEVVVERVILHHQDDDVLDLGEGVRARR